MQHSNIFKNITEAGEYSIDSKILLKTAKKHHRVKELTKLIVSLKLMLETDKKLNNSLKKMV